MIKRIPAKTKRWGNTYIINENLGIDVDGSKITEAEFKPLLETIEKIKKEIVETKLENEHLKAILFNEENINPQIVSKSKIAQDLVMMIFKVDTEKANLFSEHENKENE